MNAQYQDRWLKPVRPEDPTKTDGRQYCCGIASMHWGPNKYYYHGGETLGFNSFIGYDPVNKVTLVVRTSLTVSLDQTLTANALMIKDLDHTYIVSPLQAPPKTPQDKM